VEYPTNKFLDDRKRWRVQLSILDEAWKYVKKWNCAIDGGAYVGAWTEVLVKNFHKVYAFEPEPTNFDCMVRNVADLYHGTAAFLPIALSDKCEMLRMQHKGANFLTVMSPGGNEYPAIAIDSLKLSPGFIKLDIEGHEIPALNGAVETLERSKPVLCIELKFNKQPLKKRLHKLDYEMVCEQQPDSIWVHR